MSQPRSTDPLKNLGRVRGAGQSTFVRLYEDTLLKVAKPFILCLMGIGMLIASLVALLSTIRPIWVIGFACIATATSAVWLWNSWKQAQRDIHSLGLGHRGERAVATLLAELGKEGYILLNDVPSEDGNSNIDHILIGPPGVIVIETKTRSKPANLKPGEKATITATNSRLLRNGLPMEGDPIGQVRACAEQVKRMLAPLPDARDIPVHLVVAFPGWWVNISAPVNEVHVINPRQIFSLVRTLEAQSRGRGTTEQIERVYHVLANDVTLTLDAVAESN